MNKFLVKTSTASMNGFHFTKNGINKNVNIELSCGIELNPADNCWHPNTSIARILADHGEKLDLNYSNPLKKSSVWNINI